MEVTQILCVFITSEHKHLLWGSSKLLHYKHGGVRNDEIMSANTLKLSGLCCFCEDMRECAKVVWWRL